MKKKSVQRTIERVGVAIMCIRIHIRYFSLFFPYLIMIKVLISIMFSIKKTYFVSFLITHQYKLTKQTWQEEGENISK